MDGTGSGAARPGRAAVLVAAALVLLAGCASQYRLTACEGGRPAIERTLDVAPPNC